MATHDELPACNKETIAELREFLPLPPEKRLHGLEPKARCHKPPTVTGADFRQQQPSSEAPTASAPTIMPNHDEQLHSKK